ncbi:hypothetical protein PPACK8108_LOCUS1728 [Phakopsora pachyrhizi]|uniref:G-patch domain-containing protein n=1 Tax=Phakopsora pachyrhizi TaxID=170000 RepID=A0AAV0AJ32_PHAPC|nr:hypothetical protein PPACK8108_LOCUS1728 [Phakopsora pachyrhizi]
MPPISQLRAVAAESGLGNLDDSLVKFGTPLPQLSSTKADKNEFLPLWQQEVRDEKGRRRLHGAFTGGFSAGYFNTVGSKEGWTPAEFKSSRADRKKKDDGSGPDGSGVPRLKTEFAQKAEDFMDEEDLAELKSRNELGTKEIFGSATTQSANFTSVGYDPLTGNLASGSGTDSFGGVVEPSELNNLLSDLVRPSDFRIGRKIMTKMGWREGQGIGPRVTYEKRKRLAIRIGVGMDPESDPEDNTERKNHLFAPFDRPMMPIRPWSGNSGLGYLNSHSSHLPSSSFRSSNVSLGKGSELKIEGQHIPQGSSFGLGALNDAEDDDQDIYDFVPEQITSDARARRLLSLKDEEDGKVSNPFKKISSHRSIIPADSSSKAFSDGAPLLEGFFLALSKEEKEVKIKLSIQVPKYWKPNPKKIFDSVRSRDHASQLKLRNRGSAPINAHDRGRMIGEKAPTKSVFDFISAKDKKRITDASKLAIESSSRDDMKLTNLKEEPHLPTSVIVPQLNPSVAKAALRGFMPFSHDLPKQERYKLYLQSQAGILPEGTKFSPKPTGKESVELINKELDGFAKSAMMFKPMSSLMASRFTSAESTASGGELAAPEPGLRQPVFDEAKVVDNDVAEIEKPKEEKVSQAAQAVRMDLFGMMTRSVKEFYPQKLLCKRLNVPNPFPEGPPNETKAKGTGSNLADFLTAHGFQPAEVNKTKDPSCNGEMMKNDWLTEKNEDRAAKDVNQVGLGDDDTQGKEILTTIRPPIDIFKAIFANDDDSEESDDEEKEESKLGCAQDQELKSDSKSPVDNPRDLVQDLLPVEKSVENGSKDEKDCWSGAVKITSMTPVAVDPRAADMISTFRPTFLRKQNGESQETSSSISKKKKTDKKSKRSKGLMSFEDELEGDDVQTSKNEERKSSSDPRKKKKKKVKLSEVEVDGEGQKGKDSNLRRKKGEREEEKDDDDEWVEKVVPSHSVSDHAEREVNEVRNLPKKLKRMTASDLMD